MSNMSNGRVTTREFYDALLDQNKSRADMETKILSRLDDITSFQSAADERFKALDKRIVVNATDIDKNETNITKVRNLNAGIALLASTIAGILGWNR